MCDNAGVQQNFQAGGPVDGPGYETIPGMIGGRQVGVAAPGADIPGVIELARGLATEGVQLPGQEVAGFTPEQRLAFGLAQEGVGSYQPFLSQATDLTQAGVSALDYGRAASLGLGEQIPGVVRQGQDIVGQAAEDVRGSTQQGIGGLAQTGGRFDPSDTRSFMNEYEDAAVQQALRDIAREGEIAGQGLRSQAVAAGAFGGSRQGVQEAALQRNVLEQQGRTAAGMRQAGFESAAQRAQQSYEDAMRRQQAAASGIGSLGVQGATAAGNLGMAGSNLGLSGIEAGLGAQGQAAGLGQGIAGLGQQMVGLGQAGQQFNLQDINSMLSVGGMGQQLTQAELDAQRANQFQDVMQPYQQLAFLSDVVTGAPSGQISTMSQPGPSVGSQALGLGLGIPAVYNSIRGMAQPVTT